VDALRELGAELRVRPGVQPPTVDAHLLHDSVVTTWRTTAGDIDVLVGIPSSPQAGLNRFDTLRGRAEPASSPAARSTWLRSRTSSPPNALPTARPTAKRSPNLRPLLISRRLAPNLSGHSRLAGNPRDPIPSPRRPLARASFRSDRVRDQLLSLWDRHNYRYVGNPHLATLPTECLRSGAHWRHQGIQGSGGRKPSVASAFGLRLHRFVPYRFGFL
jgi:hypothetical protein